jgi:hypothetical protein
MMMGVGQRERERVIPCDCLHAGSVCALLCVCVFMPMRMSCALYGMGGAALGLEVRSPGHALLFFAADDADYQDWKAKLFHYARRTYAPAAVAAAVSVRVSVCVYWRAAPPPDECARVCVHTQHRRRLSLLRRPLRPHRPRPSH